jgi:hypothetical protein
MCACAQFRGRFGFYGLKYNAQVNRQKCGAFLSALNRQLDNIGELLPFVELSCLHK